MSREVRRVPLDWKHPTRPDPYYNERAWWRTDDRPTSRLLAPGMTFVGLMGSHADAFAHWQEDRDSITNRSGHHWEFHVEYHLTGFQGREDDALTVHPFYVWDDDGNEQAAITVRDVDHLAELMLADRDGGRPDPAHYMPAFDEPENSLGWCLYETVSEGTPCTPVFATAEELVDHLATVGQDYDQKPMRREAAETIVRQGGTFGSLMVLGGTVYRSAEDADRLAAAIGVTP